MSKIKVLVIDDEESIINLVTSYLRTEVDGEQQISN
jgi:CheY-like chemotaxis protein